MAKDSDKDRWTYDVIERYGSNVIVIYDDGTSVGNITVDEDDIRLWTIAIRILNLNPYHRMKIVEKMDAQGI